MVWEVRMSRSRNLPYFYNTETKGSSWEAPQGMTAEDVKKLQGAELLDAEGAKPVGGQPGQVRASHILVKHKDSRRPRSWKEETITRTKEEAIELLTKFKEEIGDSPDKFAEIASKESHCSSHENGGDLGWFGRGDMQKAFEDAVYDMEIGKISDIVSTDSGVHILLRTG